MAVGNIDTIINIALVWSEYYNRSGHNDKKLCPYMIHTASGLKFSLCHVKFDQSDDADDDNVNNNSNNKINNYYY